MRKRLFAAFLALALCAGLRPAMAAEADPDFVIDENGVLTEYTGPGGDVVVPEGVTAIGVGAFHYNVDLTSVTVPEGVTELGSSAFQGCSGLKKVVLPDSMTAIGRDAFWNCEALTSIRLPAGLTEFRECLFWGCTSLTSIDIPDGVTEISESAFSGCTALTTINIPKSVTSIGVDAFEETPWLERQGEFVVVNGILLSYRGLGGSVTVPDGVTRINSLVFRDRYDLTGVKLPDGVTSIGWQAFSGCTNLSGLTLPDSLTFIDEQAFQSCHMLRSLTIPDSVTEIGDMAFSGCSGLTSVTLPRGLTRIGGFTFSGCSGLTAIDIPDSVTSIGASAFGKCSGLKRVVIPDGVTFIGSLAFDRCSGLTDIAIPEGLTDIGEGAFSETPWLAAKGDFPVVNGVLLAYQGTDRNVVIPDSVTRIGKNAFAGCGDLASASIPGSVAEIGDYAFTGCWRLTDVVIADGTAEIGDNAFLNCDALAHVIVPSSVTRIGEHAFERLEQGYTYTNYFPLKNLTLCGEADSAIASYAEENKISFTPGKAPLLFADLKPDAFYLDAVAWAVEQGVTTGKTIAAFAPKESCTTGQILTFLWRAAGKPESGADTPLKMDGSEYYYGAAKWACEKGMIGADFDHHTPCTRASAVTFIWQAFGAPETDVSGRFTDVPEDAGYLQAAEWAVDHAVTTGTGDGSTFSPNSVCSRGEIVTFLYRAYGN